MTGPPINQELLLFSTDPTPHLPYPPITSQPTPQTRIMLTSGKIWNLTEKAMIQNGIGFISATHLCIKKPMPMSISVKLNKLKLFPGPILHILIHQNHLNLSTAHVVNSIRVLMVSSMILE